MPGTYQTFRKDLEEHLPFVAVAVSYKVRATGEIVEKKNLDRLPYKKMGASDAHDIRWESATVAIKDVVAFHQSLRHNPGCGGTAWCVFSMDGVKESNSTNFTLHCTSLKFEHCQKVHIINVVKPRDYAFYDLRFHLTPLLEDIA